MTLTDEELFTVVLK